MDYNTDRPKLVLKEYGRNIQKLAEYVTSLEGKEKRTKYATMLIQLMKQITPNTKDSPEYSQRLWDDLYILSDFKLDVDSPFPMPSPDVIRKKPERVAYQYSKVDFKHYGKNIKLMVDQAVLLEDEEEKFAAVVKICRLMKSFYMTWNKENVENQVIYENLKLLSRGKLEIDQERMEAENLLYTPRGDFGQKNQPSNYSSNSSKRRPSGGGSNHNKWRKN